MGAVSGDVIDPIHDLVFSFDGLAYFLIICKEHLFLRIRFNEAPNKKPYFFHNIQLPFIVKVGESNMSSDTQSVFESG